MNMYATLFSLNGILKALDGILIMIGIITRGRL